jgi:cyclophilin family peptidyl-prolyl cis-trans isomerase
MNTQLAPPKAGDKVATLETSMGTIKFKLFTSQVPEMTKNFETLANEGKYTNVPFHRVIQDFMIQTGDFNNKNGSGGYSYKGPGTDLNDEIVPELKHLYGTVAMANRGPNTNGSQFYIVTNKNGTPGLDGGYTIFGQVYEGMDVALQIVALQTPGGEAPTKEVLIKTAAVEVLK